MPQRAAPLAGLELLGGTRSTGDEMPCGKKEVCRTSSSKMWNHSTEVIPASDEGYVSGSKLNEPRTEASCFTPCC